jgi:ATP-dependent DNA helicase RecG
MSDAFSRLVKVLALERQQGYRNKAVIGGLDKFASRWEADARAEASNPTAVNEIVTLLLGYPAIEDTAARERIIEQITRRIKEAAPGLSIGPERRPEKPDRAPSPHTTPMTAALDAARGSDSQGAPDRRIPESPEPGAPALVARADLIQSAGPVPASFGVEGDPLPSLGGGGVPAQPGVEVGTPQEGKERERTVEPTLPAKSKPLVSSAAEQASLRPVPAATKPEPLLAEPPGQVKLEDNAGSSRQGPRGERPAAGAPERPARVREPLSGLGAPVTRLPSVGPSLAQRLEKLGVRTIRDLLYLLPTRYEDYSRLRTIERLEFGEHVTVIGTVWSLESRLVGENRKMVTAVVGDGTGEIQMTWFNPFVERRLRSGRAYTFGGKIDSYRGRLLMRNPEFEPLERHQVHTGRLVPIYPLTEGISARWLRRIMDHAVNAWAAEVSDFLPEQVRQHSHLVTLGEALRQIHFPDNSERLEAAHRRLSFDEFFLLQLGVLGQRKRFHENQARPLKADEELLAPFLGSLSFALTGAQQRAIHEIMGDLRGSHPMSRLLQGDVGSGKTAVAAAALWMAVANGCQGAIMAPTEILAEQHARSFGAVFDSLTVHQAGRPVRIALLTGSMRRSDRDSALTALAEGQIDIVIGTHALIQGGVSFRDLAVAVVDEQHRFGVEQRGALRQKGIQPHILVMSATPIPRSLALTIYGDLDITVLDEMPAGRLPVKTKWLTSSQRERAYTFIRRQVQEGRQAFIIYPLVEETETGAENPSLAAGDVRSAVEAHRWLHRDVFSDLRLGLLHGRMQGEEKDAVMRSFGAGEIDILVATSVVEVGIDVPNASVIMVEGADRFGLAQLHQFRGRVGRGQHPSFCILISDAAEGDSTQRLQALESSNDGFALAQTDLDMRGPGDFFGTRQSGLPPLRTAQLGDLRTLEIARSAAQRVFETDPALSNPEHRELAEQVSVFWSGTGDRS